MKEVKWIKLASNIFDNRKIKQIECMPEGDSIILIWLKLLCLAGDINDSGMIYFTKEIPYTDQMLASQFNRPLATIQFALKTFQHFGMIELVDDMLHISNWEKYQNVEGMEKIREQNRLRKQKERERKKLSQSDSHVTVMACHATDKEEDKDKEIEIDNIPPIVPQRDKPTQPSPVSQVFDLYNQICISYPKITAFSESRKKAIKARLNSGYTIDDFKKLFKKSEESEFLKGKNNRNWSANFDWLIKDSNMAKVLDGNYDKKNPSDVSQSDHSYDLNDFKSFVNNFEVVEDG